MRSLLLSSTVCALASISAPSVAFADDPAEAEHEEAKESPSFAQMALSIPLRPTVLAEVDYRAYPSEAEGNTGFALARLRPGLTLTPASWFRAVTAVEFAGEGPSILDAFMTLRATNFLEFDVGYSRPPLFASARYEPVHIQPFPDQAPVVSAFQVKRDLGADAHLAPKAIPVEAWIRIGNGTGSALGNDNPLPAGYGSVDLVLGRPWVGAKGDRTFGLRLGVGGLVEEVRDRDGVIGTTPLGFVYYRPIVVSGKRVVSEAHFVAYAGPVRVTLEGAYARESRSKDTDGNPNTPRVDLPSMNSYGFTGEVAWVLRGEPREVGLAPQGPSETTPGERRGWNGGALELAARYDAMWLGRGASDIAPGGSQSGALAMKWWVTNFFAASMAGFATHYETPAVERPFTYWSVGGLVRASFFWGLGSQRQGLLEGPSSRPSSEASDEHP